MGILQYIPAKDFYTTTEPNQYKPGQFCWVVSPVIEPIPRILDVKRSDPTEHEKIDFTMRNANSERDFRAADRTLPIKYLNLRTHEELLLQRAKKRPGIVISNNLDIYPAITALLKRAAKKHLQEDSLFVIPCYGVEGNGDLSGFPPEMVLRIRCLLYRQFFYLPVSTTFDESIARFDRIQIVVGRDRSAIEPTNNCLSEAAFNLFLALFLFCATGIEDSDLSTIISMTRECFPGTP
jgi:hypothetical protein